MVHASLASPIAFAAAYTVLDTNATATAPGVINGNAKPAAAIAVPITPTAAHNASNPSIVVSGLAISSLHSVTAWLNRYAALYTVPATNKTAIAPLITLPIALPASFIILVPPIVTAVKTPSTPRVSHESKSLPTLTVWTSKYDVAKNPADMITRPNVPLI